MNIFRLITIVTLFWCVGLQPIKAGNLLSKEDSVALAKMYAEYKMAMESAHEKMLSSLRQLDSSDSLYEKKRDDIEHLYENEIKTLKKDFDTSLAKKKRFRKVVKLRNLLMNYLSLRDAAEANMNKRYENDGNGLLYWGYIEEYLNPFVFEWDGKFIELIRQNPDFMDYPDYLFEEVNESMKVVTSPDGLLRYYNWKTRNTRFYDNLNSFKQFRTEDGDVVVSWETNENSSEWEGNDWVVNIYILEDDDSKMYLLEKWGSEMFRLHYTFQVERFWGRKPIHPYLFEIDNNLSDHLTVSYNEDLNDLTDFDWIAKYDEATRTIYVRKYKDEENLILSDKYITYVFDEGMFKHFYAEDIDLAFIYITSYIEAGIYYRDINTLFDLPKKILQGYIDDKKYDNCDRSLVKDMLERIENQDKIANILYLGAAIKGDKVAQFKLANCLNKGYMGLSKNTDEAKLWFEKAANQGHWLAQQQLGLYFGDQRYDKNSQWYQNNIAEVEKTTDELREFVAQNENNKIESQIEWEREFYGFLRDHPWTLDCASTTMEQILGDEFKVVTSRDGRVRTYCWPANSGEDGQNVCCIYQFRIDEDKVRVTWGLSRSDEDEAINENNEENVSDAMLLLYEENWRPWEGNSMVTDIKGKDTSKGRFYLFDKLSGAQKRTTSAAIINEGKLFLIPIFMVDGKKKSSVTWESDEKESWINNFEIMD